MHAQQATSRYSRSFGGVGQTTPSGGWPIDFREERGGTRQMGGDMVKGGRKGRVVGKWMVELEGGNGMGMLVGN